MSAPIPMSIPTPIDIPIPVLVPVPPQLVGRKGGNRKRNILYW